MSLKKLRALARDATIDLWSMDECHFQQHGTRLRMWVPPENRDPVLLHAPTRKSVACFGAVSTATGKLCTLMRPQFNAMTFEEFLHLLMSNRRRGRRIVAILDNAKYHHARALQPWLKKNSKMLTLLFLPPYSPDLNPIERVWKLTRRLATHNRFFASLDDVVNAVSERFDIWARNNTQLKQLCAII
ncbi:MAG: IS630 family transposase [Candidatus Zhuqueibacterota bacterium]